jgi:multidrug efflux pump subunit AcrA (membrane-fusion protein)
MRKQRNFKEMRLMQKKKRKKLMIGISVAAAAAVVTVVALPMASVGRAASELPDAITHTALVERGTIETTVVGSGSLSATGTVDVDIPSGLVLDSISVEAGDRVEAGDTLAVINAASLEDMIGEVQDAIDGIDSGIASAQEDSGNATIEASVGGRVKEIYAAEGDDIKDVISRNGSFIVMSLDGKMKVEFTSEAPLSAATMLL